MDKEITLHYKPNFDTLAKVQKHMTLVSPWIIYVIVVIVFIGLNAITNNEPDTHVVRHVQQKETSFLDFLPLIFVGAYLYFIFFRRGSRLKSRLASNPKNLENQELIFNSESFTQIGETFNIKYPWNQIVKIKETKDWFLIYLTKTTAFPITKIELRGNQYYELIALFNSLDIKKNLK
jgi:hypothetical protein